MVHIGGISATTREAWERLLHEYEHTPQDYAGEIGHWVSTTFACWLFFYLKFTEDSKENFPKGKWASLQELEQLIERAIREGE